MAATTCPICRRETVVFQKLFEKHLTKDDIQGSHGVLIFKNDAAKLCGRHLGNHENVNLAFYDVENNRWAMRFRRSPQGRHFLTGDWSQFVRGKDLLCEGRNVTFYSLRCPRCMMNIGYTIGVLKLLGKPIIV
ncbi:hypothetical protein CJ030_MR0G022768 [Morella rubra]|uniref:TF-B3 domain-containing protein n=1 Tax=Morella rubra TaxID=262757 RepID=A0A6A1UG33_9ROSI|nr:hypothetical protein CJ030_MR0G022768 [Morella rubra]